MKKTKTKKIHYCLSGLFIIQILIFSACSRPSETINLAKDSSVSIFDIFSDVKVVELETNPLSFIARIDKVIFYSSKYFILDGKSQQLLWFDDRGRFVNKISAKGRGPGEYNHIIDFTIDSKNELIVLLDPAVQRIHFFSFEGSFIRTIQIDTERVMGFNKVFVLNDSTLLVSSITYEQLVFIDSNTGHVKNKEFLCPAKIHLKAFMPSYNIYQIVDETFVMPALSQDVFNVTSGKPVFHYRYSFGGNDNSPRQINALVAEIDAGRSFDFLHEGVGPGKFLNHHFFNVVETKRFKVALLEFDNNFIQVIIDKVSGNSYVFRNFEEGINLLAFSLQTEYAIGFDLGISGYLQTIPELSRRNFNFFEPSILSETERQIIANHDPMTDNPFLVVYRFRE